MVSSTRIKHLHKVEDNMSVHSRHCCILHGCKYGDEDCPVLTKKEKQEITCEDCDMDGIYNVEQAKLHKEAQTIRVISTDVDFLGELMDWLKTSKAKKDSTVIRLF